MQVLLLALLFLLPISVQAEDLGELSANPSGLSGWSGLSGQSGFSGLSGSLVNLPVRPARGPCHDRGRVSAVKANLPFGRPLVCT